METVHGHAIKISLTTLPPFSKYLLLTYCVSGPVWTLEIQRRIRTDALKELACQWGAHDNP